MLICDSINNVQDSVSLDSRKSSVTLTNTLTLMQIAILLVNEEVFECLNVGCLYLKAFDNKCISD